MYLNAEEKRNKLYIKNQLDGYSLDTNMYQIYPSGCNINIICSSIEILSIIENILLNDIDTSQIRGQVRIEYYKFIKM